MQIPECRRRCDPCDADDDCGDADCVDADACGPDGGDAGRGHRCA